MEKKISQSQVNAIFFQPNCCGNRLFDTQPNQKVDPDGSQVRLETHSWSVGRTFFVSVCPKVCPKRKVWTIHFKMPRKLSRPWKKNFCIPMPCQRNYSHLSFWMDELDWGEWSVILVYKQLLNWLMACCQSCKSLVNECFELWTLTRFVWEKIPSIP